MKSEQSEKSEKSEHEQRLHEYKGLIESELEQALHSGTAGVSRVIEAMRYSTLGTGNRIHGVLTLEFCRLFGKSINAAASVGAAIELIYASSLIHDDLPCMNNNDFRGGNPSCHKAFGEATALLAKDALISTALNTVAAVTFLPPPAKVSSKTITSVISVLSNTMIETAKGKQMEIDFKTFKNAERGSGRTAAITEEDFFGMYNRRLCASISAACVCGAICANSQDKMTHTARSFGFSLGFALQLANDLLDNNNNAKIAEGENTTFTTFKALNIIDLIGKKKTQELIEEHTNTAFKIGKSLPNGEFLTDYISLLVDRKI